MAGKLKPEEVKCVLEGLCGVNKRLASSLEMLEESQKQLEKSIKCQAYLNHSLKPVHTGFVMKEHVRSGSEAGERV